MCVRGGVSPKPAAFDRLDIRSCQRNRLEGTVEYKAAKYAKSSVLQNL